MRRKGKMKGIGDWGLGIGDWAQSPIPNPQYKIPYNSNIIMESKNSKFKILKLLGQGSFGKVYLAEKSDNQV